MPTSYSRPAEAVSRAERFAGYIREAVRAAGYDIDGPRAGGKKALAEATGMSPTSIGRMLSGQTLPDPANLERISQALHIPLTELLVRTGLVSDRARVDRERTESVDLTPTEAARRLGIRDPDKVRIFAAMVETLRDQG